MHTAPFWSWQLIGAMIITFVVQGVTIGAYAARLAGVQTGRIATSISLFNLFVTFGRLARLFRPSAMPTCGFAMGSALLLSLMS